MATLAPSNDAPTGKRRRGKLPLMLAGLAAVVLTVILANHYLGRHQPVFIVSGLATPVTVEIPGAPPVEIPARGMRRVGLPEGDHRAEISGATNLTVAFSVDAPFGRRWSDRRAFIVNVAGSAIVLEETTYYGTEREAANAADRAGDHRLHYGEPFLVVSNVDYFFQPFPDQVKADTRRGRASRRRVDLVSLDARQLFYAMTAEEDFAEALRLAEWYLESHPDQTDLLPTYVGAARLAGEEERARAFLARGARRRPVDIQWHRMYQELGHEDPASLVAEYDRLLRARPDDSAWLYLRGRLAETCEASAAYYRRAVDADPRNAFAHFALGMVRSSQKRWTEARASLATAVGLAPDNAQFRNSLFEARLALREYEALEKDLTARLEENPLHYQDNVRLADVYAVLERDQALRDLLMRFAQGMHERFQKAGLEAVVNLDARVAYSIGNFAEIEALAESLGDVFPKYALFQAWIEQGKFEDAFSLFPLDDARVEEPLHYLTVSLALRQGGRNEEAAVWLDRALELLAASRPEYKVVGRLLGGAEAPSPPEILDLVLAPSAKARICAAFGLQFPSIQEVMFEEAREFNVSREYPFHLLNRILDNASVARPAPDAPAGAGP